MQDRRVEGAPGRRAVGGDRTCEEVRVRAVDEVEGAVAREEEGVAGGCRVSEGVQGLGERDVEAANAEQAVQGGQRVRERELVQETVDRADAQGIAGGVHEEDQP